MAEKIRTDNENSSSLAIRNNSSSSINKVLNQGYRLLLRRMSYLLSCFFHFFSRFLTSVFHFFTSIFNSFVYFFPCAFCRALFLLRPITNNAVIKIKKSFFKKDMVNLLAQYLRTNTEHLSKLLFTEKLQRAKPKMPIIIKQIATMQFNNLGINRINMPAIKDTKGSYARLICIYQLLIDLFTQLKLFIHPLLHRLINVFYFVSA